MQWLIDYVLKNLKQHVGYFRRFPPATWDWDMPEINADTNWHLRDASAIVPVNTKAVVLRCQGQASASNRVLNLRPTDSDVGPERANFRMQDANQVIEMDKILSLVPERTFQSRVSSTTWTILRISIVGYWITGNYMNSFNNRGDPGVADFNTSDFILDNTWRALDLSIIIPAGTQCISCQCQVLGATPGQLIEFRTKGNSNDINISACPVVVASIRGYYDIDIPTNGLQTIDYRSNLTGGPIILLTIKGWWF